MAWRKIYESSGRKPISLATCMHSILFSVLPLSSVFFPATDDFSTSTPGVSRVRKNREFSRGGNRCLLLITGVVWALGVSRQNLCPLSWAIIRISVTIFQGYQSSMSLYPQRKVPLPLEPPLTLDFVIVLGNDFLENYPWTIGSSPQMSWFVKSASSRSFPF